MRKTPSRDQFEALHRLRIEPNTEGDLDGLTWAGTRGLFVQRRGNNATWLLRWNVRGKKRVMGLGSRREVSDDRAFARAAKYMAIVDAGGGDPIAVRDEERAAAGLKPVRSTAPEAAPTAKTFRDVARTVERITEDGRTTYRIPSVPAEG